MASLGGKATTTSAGSGSDRRQAALAYARCMRQHGINLSDPKPDGGIERAPAVAENTPKFKAAEQACGQRGGGGK